MLLLTFESKWFDCPEMAQNENTVAFTGPCCQGHQQQKHLTLTASLYVSTTLFILSKLFLKYVDEQMFGRTPMISLTWSVECIYRSCSAGAAPCPWPPGGLHTPTEWSPWSGRLMVRQPSYHFRPHWPDRNHPPLLEYCLFQGSGACREVVNIKNILQRTKTRTTSDLLTRGRP